MQQIKIFRGLETETEQLEQTVNAWLRSTGVRVIQMFGNIAPQTVLHVQSGGPVVGAESGVSRRFGPSDILLVVLYEPGTRD